MICIFGQLGLLNCLKSIKFEFKTCTCYTRYRFAVFQSQKGCKDATPFSSRPNPTDNHPSTDQPISLCSTLNPDIEPDVTTVSIEPTSSMHSMKYLKTETPRRKQRKQKQKNLSEKSSNPVNLDSEFEMKKAYINITGENLPVKPQTVHLSCKTRMSPEMILGNDRIIPAGPSGKLRRLRSAPLASLMRQEPRNERKPGSNFFWEKSAFFENRGNFFQPNPHSNQNLIQIECELDKRIIVNIEKKAFPPGT